MANSTSDGGPVTVQQLPVTDPVTPTPPKSPANPNASQSVDPTHASKGPNLASLATAGLSTPLQSKSNKRGVPAEFDPPPYTAAAALADERRHREALERQSAHLKSPNLAMSAINTLKGGLNNNMSRPNDAPPAGQNNAAPPLIITQSAPVAEPTQMQTSPVSISSAEGSVAGLAPTAGANMATVESPTSVDAPNSLRAPVEDHSNKAMTYPPSRSMELQDVRRDHPRNMSLPSAGFGSPRSPSAKKHKCPYCDTDFTRHHNLKSHLLTHSQEKPYVCQTCQARFRRLHDLKRHTKLHTGERPHICDKCGRKFARGDALARHNKGQGGCAGRRSSMGGEDDYGEGNSGGDDMDGLSYQHDGSEGDNGVELGRRKSEPNHRAIRDAMNRVDSGPNAYSRQPTTYPGSAVMKATRGTMYPPTSHNNAGTSPRSGNQHLSPRPAGSSLSSHLNTSQPPMYAHSNMTESPRPLSPGQADQQRMNIDHQNYRSRSPHQQQYRGSGYGTPPTVLPPMTGPQQLPSLPGLAPDPRHVVPSQNSPSSNKTGSFPSVHHASGSGSHHSSGSSIRDAMGSTDVWEYIRSLESRFSRMQDEMNSQLKSQEAHYEARITELQGELDTLKNGQPPQSSKPQQHLPPSTSSR